LKFTQLANCILLRVIHVRTIAAPNCASTN